MGELPADLPEPPRRLRRLAIAVLALTAAACAQTALSLAPEARYAFSPDQAIDVGQFEQAKLDGLAGHYVRARVQLPDEPAIAFHRPGETERRIARLREGGCEMAHSCEQALFVEYALSRGAGRQFPTNFSLPPRLVAGRLVSLHDLGLRHRGLAQRLKGIAGRGAKDALLLIDGEDPRAAYWAVALEALVCGFFAFCAASLVRITRRRAD